MIDKKNLLFKKNLELYCSLYNLQTKKMAMKMTHTTVQGVE